jgi:hypothetical protein
MTETGYCISHAAPNERVVPLAQSLGRGTLGKRRLLLLLGLPSLPSPTRFRFRNVDQFRDFSIRSIRSTRSISG